MSLLSTLVACWGTNDGGSSPAQLSLVSENKTMTLIVGGGGGKIGGRSGRQVVHWRPTLCTIAEEDVIKTEMIQLYVTPCSNNNKGNKNTRVLSYDYKPSEYKKEFVLRDSWNMVSPVPSSFLF